MGQSEKTVTGKEQEKVSELTERAQKEESRYWKSLTEKKVERLMSENPDRVALGGQGQTLRSLPEVKLTEKAVEEQKQKMRERSPSRVTVQVLVEYSKEERERRISEFKKMTGRK